jgi:sorting nexin-9/18/33
MNLCMCAQETENGVAWNVITEPYSCMVASPKKESKLKGLKSFIAYQLTPSVRNFKLGLFITFVQQ